MTKNEIDDALDKISASLEPCPICKGKAEILAMHATLKEVVIDSIGCRKCHLAVERKWRLAESDKLFPVLCDYLLKCTYCIWIKFIKMTGFYKGSSVMP